MFIPFTTFEKMECLSRYQMECIVIVGSIIILYIPFIGKVFRVINTMVHESGHAMMALFTSGEVDSIELNPNASGLTKTRSKNAFASIAITLSGYLFASIFAWISFWILVNKGYPWFFFLVLATALLNLMLWVRSGFGIFWIIIFITIIGLVWWYFPGKVSTLFALALATMLQFESLFSTFVLMKIALLKSSAAGDAAQLQKILWLPAAIWALFFISFALFCTWNVLLMIPCKEIFS
jgi:hypothetical protein